MDLCARATGVDPVEFRLRHLSGNGPDQRRMTGVIRLAAEKAGWGKPLPEGHHHGFAAHKSFNTYVAEVCEVSVNADGVITIENVIAAVDCGVAVTPDVIRAQIEGGIGYGIGHAMRAELTLTDGQVDQSNFHDFDTLRIHDTEQHRNTYRAVNGIPDRRRRAGHAAGCPRPGERDHRSRAIPAR